MWEGNSQTALPWKKEHLEKRSDLRIESWDTPCFRGRGRKNPAKDMMNECGVSETQLLGVREIKSFWKEEGTENINCLAGRPCGTRTDK